MSLNTLLRKYLTKFDKITELYGYHDSWCQSSSGIVKRNALRCKTMALIYLDRNEEITNDL